MTLNDGLLAALILVASLTAIFYIVRVVERRKVKTALAASIQTQIESAKEAHSMVTAARLPTKELMLGASPEAPAIQITMILK